MGFKDFDKFFCRFNAIIMEMYGVIRSLIVFVSWYVGVVTCEIIGRSG